MSDSIQEHSHPPADDATNALVAASCVTAATNIIEQGRSPLTLFLEDCLSSIDANYYQSIVLRFQRTRDEEDERRRLYKGEASPKDERGQLRASLHEWDTLFILHLFEFCVAGRYVQGLAEGWHPQLMVHFPFDRGGISRQIDAVRRNRNKTQHHPHAIKTSQDVDFIRNESLKLFLENVVGIIERRPAFFREETSRSNMDYVRWLQSLRIDAYVEEIQRASAKAEFAPALRTTDSLEHSTFVADDDTNQIYAEAATPAPDSDSAGSPNDQTPPHDVKHLWKYISVGVLGMVVVTVALVQFGHTVGNDNGVPRVSASEWIRHDPTATLVIVVTQRLDAERRRKFVSRMRDVYPKDSVIRVAVVWEDDRVRESLISVLSDQELCAMLDTLTVEPMTDLKHFTAAFHDGYQLMCRYVATNHPVSMAILGSLPETSAEKYRQLVAEKWNPVEKEDLPKVWNRSNFGTLRWFRGTAVRHDEREFVDNVLCRKGDTLRPKEIQL